LNHKGIGRDDPLVRRQGHRALDRIKALTDSVLTANLMLVKKPFKGAAPGQLGGFERGPLTQKVTKQHRILIRTPLEDLRERSLQRTGQSVCYPNPIGHQSATVFNQLSQGSHLGTLRRERHF
jgi:hypothetical protein